jgi:hypothetical protein
MVPRWFVVTSLEQAGGAHRVLSTAALSGSACGMLGDQVVSWGGRDAKFNPSNKTYMKAETWCSRYISPGTPASTTAVGLQTPTGASTSTCTPNRVDESPGVKKDVVNIAIVFGVMAMVAPVVVSVSIGYRMRPKGLISKTAWHSWICL